MTTTKPVVQSVTIWSSLLTFIPLIVAELPNLVEQVTPILTPQVAAIVSSVGGVLIILRRLFSQNKRLTVK